MKFIKKQYKISDTVYLENENNYLDDYEKYKNELFLSIYYKDQLVGSLQGKFIKIQNKKRKNTRELYQTFIGENRSLLGESMAKFFDRINNYNGGFANSIPKDMNSFFYFDIISIEKENQEKGIGKSVLTKLKDIVNYYCQTVDYMFLSPFPLGENRGSLEYLNILVDLYKKCGFEPLKDNDFANMFCMIYDIKKGDEKI